MNDLVQHQLRELALFAGAGGGILGGQLLGWRVVCAVDVGRPINPLGIAAQIQGKKDEAEKKSMEKLLDHIDVRGNIITIDANGAAPTIIDKIAMKNGDCVIGLKDNQRMSKRLAKDLFEQEKVQQDKKIIIQNNKAHGREEKRIYEFLILKDFKIAGMPVIEAWARCEHENASFT